jgi:hypothetical protein
VATGAVTQVGSLRRVLGAGAPGSQGVSVAFVVRLGKTPTQALLLNITATLASPAALKPALATTAASLAAASGLDVRTLSAAVPEGSVAVANSPFALGGGPTVVAAAAAGDSGGATGSAAAGGIVGAVLLACAIWARRSYAKHGAMPCCRDRNRELRSRAETQEHPMSTGMPRPAWSVHARPPTRAPASSVRTDTPALIRRLVAAMPAAPAPTTITSGFV